MPPSRLISGELPTVMSRHFLGGRLIRIAVADEVVPSDRSLRLLTSRRRASETRSEPPFTAVLTLVNLFIRRSVPSLSAASAATCSTAGDRVISPDPAANGDHERRRRRKGRKRRDDLGGRGGPSGDGTMWCGVDRRRLRRRCVMASRLCARPENRVLLIEAGTDYPPDALPAQLEDGFAGVAYNDPQYIRPSSASSCRRAPATRPIRGRTSSTSRDG